MARKKKSTLKTTKETSQLNTSSQLVSYQGKIKLQVLKGDKVVATEYYSNNGLFPLFKFISLALAGQYYEDLRPNKIALFYYNNEMTNASYSSPSDFNWEDANLKNIITPISPYIVYNNMPISTKTKNGYSTTFRFKIPSYWLYNKQFNVVGLYTNAGEACAYYLLTEEKVTKDNEEKDIKTIVWNTKKLLDNAENYSLILEWTMEISNK